MFKVQDLGRLVVVQGFGLGFGICVLRHTRFWSGACDLGRKSLESIGSPPSNKHQAAAFPTWVFEVVHGLVSLGLVHTQT